MEKIIVALDGSDVSRKAYELAQMVCKAEPQVHVFLMHVLEPIPMLIGSPKREELHDEMKAQAEDLLRPFKDDLERLGISASLSTPMGNAGDMILETAKKEHCSMIIMGANGKSSMQEILLGSVSQRVLQFSKIPVLVAR